MLFYACFCPFNFCRENETFQLQSRRCSRYTVTPYRKKDLKISHSYNTKTRAWFGIRYFFQKSKITVQYTYRLQLHNVACEMEKNKVRHCTAIRKTSYTIYYVTRQLLHSSEKWHLEITKNIILCFSRR